MKQMRKLLWLVGLLMVAGNDLAGAQVDQEKLLGGNPNGTIKVNASFEARGAFDFGNYCAGPDFGPAIIPMGGGTKDGKRALFDIPGAVLKIEKEMLVPGGDIIKIVVQTNLGKELKLRSIYADLKGLRIGKAASNFSDPDACGLVGGRFLQARWQHKLTAPFSFAIAIEETPDLVIYPKEKKDDQAKKPLQPQKNIPAVSAHVRYEQEKLWHVQLSGLLRVLEYRNTTNKLDVYMPTWGINMGTALHVVPEQTTLKLQGVYGQGIGSYVADLADLENEDSTIYATNENEDASARKTLDAWGVAVGATHKWLPKLCSEATYRFVSSIDNQREKDAYQYGHACSINLFYHPIEQLKVGAEYLVGIRRNITGDSKDAHRIQAVIGFDL